MNTKSKKRIKLTDLTTNTQENLPDKTFVWSAREYQFLVIYRKTLDIEKARRETSIPSSTFSRLLNDEKMKQALEKAKEDFAEAAAMDGNCAKSDFRRIFKKIESQFDKAGEKSIGSLAGSLASMTNTALKATGQLEKDNNNIRPEISININLGEYSNKKNIKDIVVNEKLIKNNT